MGLSLISLGTYLLGPRILSRGLEGKYYANLKWEGEPQFITLDPEISSELLKNRRRRFPENQFSVEWSGFMVIEKSGDYTFATDSDDGSWLYVNDQRVVDNGGVHGSRKVSGRIYLKAGTYPIRLRYFQGGGYYRIHLFWARGDRPLEDLPSYVLWPRSPGYVYYQLGRVLDPFRVLLNRIWLGTLMYFITAHLFRFIFPYGLNWRQFRKSFLHHAKRMIPNLALLCGSVGVFLLIAEGVFRIAGVARVEPYLDKDWQAKYVRLNSKGFRDYEHAQKKPPGTVRILGLGDSYAFGARVKFEDIYLTQLERMLNARYPTRRYEVMNMGISGYNTLNELNLLKSQGLLYQPDLLIVGYVLNDAESSALQAPYKRKIKELLEKESDYSKKLQQISHFYRYVRFLYVWGASRKVLDQNDYLDSLYSEKSNPYLPVTQQALAEMIQLVKRQKGQVLIVLFPIFSLDPHEEERFVKARRMVQRICEENGATFLDTYPYFREAFKSGKIKRYWATPFDAHPGKDAHKIFAEQIFRTIVTENLVDLES